MHRVQHVHTCQHVYPQCVCTFVCMYVCMYVFYVVCMTACMYVHVLCMWWLCTVYQFVCKMQDITIIGQQLRRKQNCWTRAAEMLQTYNGCKLPLEFLEKLASTFLSSLSQYACTFGGQSTAIVKLFLSGFFTKGACIHVTCVVSPIAGISTMISVQNLEWKDNILQPPKCLGD